MELEYEPTEEEMAEYANRVYSEEVEWGLVDPTEE